MPNCLSVIKTAKSQAMKYVGKSTRVKSETGKTHLNPAPSYDF